MKIKIFGLMPDLVKGKYRFCTFIETTNQSLVPNYITGTQQIL